MFIDSHIHSLIALLELLEQYQQQYSSLQNHISESICHRKDYNIGLFVIFFFSFIKNNIILILYLLIVISNQQIGI